MAYITPLVINGLGGGHTDTHSHIHTHTDAQTKTILKISGMRRKPDLKMTCMKFVFLENLCFYNVSNMMSLIMI